MKPERKLLPVLAAADADNDDDDDDAEDSFSAGPENELQRPQGPPQGELVGLETFTRVGRMTTVEAMTPCRLLQICTELGRWWRSVIRAPLKHSCHQSKI